MPAASIARTANSWRPGLTRTFAGEVQALNGAPSSAHSNRSPLSWLPAPKANRARRFAVRFAGVSSSLVFGAVASRLIVTVFAVTPPALVAVQLNTAPSVSVEIVAGSQPLAVTDDSGSEIDQLTLTSLR